MQTPVLEIRLMKPKSSEINYEILLEKFLLMVSELFLQSKHLLGRQLTRSQENFLRRPTKPGAHSGSLRVGRRNSQKRQENKKQKTKKTHISVDKLRSVGCSHAHVGSRLLSPIYCDWDQSPFHKCSGVGQYNSTI